MRPDYLFGKAGCYPDVHLDLEYNEKGNAVKKRLAVFAAVFLAVALMPAHAGQFGELRGKLSAARESLVVMVFQKDKRGPEQQKLVKDTADAVSAQLAKMKAPMGKGTQFKELVDTWQAFKDTREQELVPAILKGDDETVKRLVWGIQKDRYTKCMALIREIDEHEKSMAANTGEYAELRTRISDARTSLLLMMTHKDKRGAEQQKLVKDTADVVSIQLAEMKAPAGKETQFRELVATWSAFKETREKELVPALLRGDDDEAKKISYGIQKERVTKCMELSRELDDSQKIVLASSRAGDFDEFRARLSAARESLLAMIVDKNKRGPEQQKLVKDTADAVSAQLARMKAPLGKEAQFNEFVATWNAFKETREKELVPALLKGNDEVARKITYGIQNERIKKCLAYARELDN